jgi:high-affinity iron transporter
MILRGLIALTLLCFGAGRGHAMRGPQSVDSVALVRRVAATVQLAVQEYGLGVRDGKVVAQAEVDEARLFLSEAGRTAGRLPSGSMQVRAGIDQVLKLVQRLAPSDSVSAAGKRFIEGLATRYQIALDDVPDQAPSLARGASIYQLQCARCHGGLGLGDGKDGKGLDPAPANLADAAALADVSPLDFYRRVTVGVAGTAMPSYESTLTSEERWAVALYASTLHLPAPTGTVPPALTAFATTARLSDRQLIAALGEGANPSRVAAVRAASATVAADGGRAEAVFDAVRKTVAGAVEASRAGRHEEARQAAFDAYLTFEQVERQVRARDAALAGEVEAAFAALRTTAESGGQEFARAEQTLDAVLERAERLTADRPSQLNLFLQSFVLLVREGLEAILVVGALITFLVKTGAGDRRRDIHIGVGAAVGVSLLTAFLLETVFRLSQARQELLEGFTMVAAAVMLFYVSYWLLTKVEVAKWNAFMKAQVKNALSSGSAFALASVAFLAVYREGFETVLFYKALMVSGGTGSLFPILAGMALGSLVLIVVYVAINRFGVRLPLRPFFTVTSTFLYYMAFVFAGKAVAELQEGGLIGTTRVSWAPRIPALGIYPTMESLLAQATLILLAIVAVAWIFLIAPARERRRQRAIAPKLDDKELVRSLDRIDADLAEARAELERVRDRLSVSSDQQ